MPDFELFNGTNLEEPDADHRIAMNKPSLGGAFFVRWDAFKNLIRSFTVSKDTDQSITGNKTFTGIVNVQAPTSDNNPVTLKYFNDNAGGGEEIIEVATYANLPATGDASVLYVVLDENVLYRWSGTVYVSMSSPLSYASQAEMELAESTENTKVVTPLRAWQGFVYWCANTTFEALTTAAKTVIGAIDELKSTITGILTELGLKATQNPGVCARCRIYPDDIVVDPIAMTVSVVTVKNGQTISASCPLRFFTDGDGVIHKWEFTAPITASFTKINGIWGFYINQTGQVVCDQTPWSDYATIATILRFYLNDQLPDADMIEPVCYEAHTTDISASDHEWMHAQGTVYVSGFDHVSNQLTIDANGRPTTAPNADGRNTVIALTTGKSSDDGLTHTVKNSTDGAQFSQDLGNTTAVSLNATNSALFRIRTNDADGRLSFLPATRFPFPWNTVNNSPQFITTAGVRTDVADNRWFVVFVYDFPDSVNGRAVKVVTAPQEFATYALAVAYQWESIQGAYATMRDKESRPLYKEIYHCDKAVGATYPVECKYAAKCSTTDIRTLKPSQTSASSGAVLASNVSVIPTTDFTATDQQTFDIDAGTRIVKLETDETPDTIDDTDNVRFKSATGYYVRTLLAIKNYVLAGLSAANVALTPALWFVSTNVQSFASEIAGRVLSATTTEKTTPIAADSVGIWDSATSLFKRVTFANLKTFVLNGLSTLNIINSSNLPGTTLDDVLNVADSVEETTLLDGDIMAFARMNGAVSENKMIDVADAKAYFTNGQGNVYYASSFAELVSICAGIPESETHATIYLTNNAFVLGGATVLNVHTRNIIIISASYNVFVSAVFTINNTADHDIDMYIDAILYYGSGGSNTLTLTGTNAINVAVKAITGTGSGSDTLTGSLTYNYAEGINPLTASQKNIWLPYSEKEFLVNTFTSQGFNQVKATITRSGHVTIQALVTFAKGESGSVILLPQSPNRIISFFKGSMTFLSSDAVQGGDSYIYGLIELPRFEGQDDAWPQSVNGATLGERYLYQYNAGIGGSQYLTTSNKAIDLSTGNLLLNYSNTQTDTQNRAWYSIILEGHCCTSRGNWVDLV